MRLNNGNDMNKLMTIFMHLSTTNELELIISFIIL